MRIISNTFYLEEINSNFPSGLELEDANCAALDANIYVTLRQFRAYIQRMKLLFQKVSLTQMELYTVPSDAQKKAMIFSQAGKVSNTFSSLSENYWGTDK